MLVSKGKSLSNDNRGFRKKTEQYLSGKPKKEPPRESASLTHELQVHQIELEMQNEELRRAQHETEESQARYADLYDFAPVGYLTLDEKGLISQLNLTAAALLGIERTVPHQQTFFLFSQTGISGHILSPQRKKCSNLIPEQTCELVLKRKDGTLFDGQLESTAADVQRKSGDPNHAHGYNGAQTGRAKSSERG